ncbi:hypothetical protein [Arsenophonus nasoniae]|uniref:Uncharacterized protein n=1 Tax=Arsenophonus nasoniae TaxID=638 RepID=A0AA95GCY5_9GAMM|nr:hypothetical protein [Arsenophonus nasoniae]WGL93895.1 hypothetical protein QE207_00705 [Arsenophonus nasoniae]
MIPEDYKVTVRIPKSVVDVIDAISEKRINDGEGKSSCNRTAIALEMLKLGCRIMKKNIDKDSNETPSISVDDKLALIAESVLKTEYFANTIFLGGRGDIDKAKHQGAEENYKKYLSELKYKLNYFFNQK